MSIFVNTSECLPYMLLCWKQGGFIMNVDIEKPNTAPASSGHLWSRGFRRRPANLGRRVLPQFRSFKDSKLLQFIILLRFCTSDVKTLRYGSK